LEPAAKLTGKAHIPTIMESRIIKHAKSWFTQEAREWPIFCICLICIFLFLSTAYNKVVEHARFLKGISRIAIIGGFASYLSLLVPAAEILVAVLLIIPKTCKWGLYGFIFLMSLFTGYIMSMVFWAEKLPCHCSGAIEKLSWAQHIWFNLAFIALAVLALWLSKKKINLKNHKYEQH
jgi:hypothetical protein